MKQRYTIYALFLLSLFVSISASAQIKGVITDSLTNEPLMYITVQYEGKGVGGISNANGEYQVETRKGWDELTFSAVGYITKKVIHSFPTRRSSEIGRASCRERV